MTDKTRILGVRLPNEVVDWYQAGNSNARNVLQAVYESRGSVSEISSGIRLGAFKAACDRLNMDYQLVIDRVTEHIIELFAETRPRGRISRDRKEAERRRKEAWAIYGENPDLGMPKPKKKVDGN